MDAYGNRLTKKDLKNLFKEPPAFKPNEVCHLFQVEADTLTDFLQTETTTTQRLRQTSLLRNEEQELLSHIKVTDDKVAKVAIELTQEERQKIADRFKIYKFQPSLPKSYTENTLFEIEMIKKADNFHRQFRFLYPQRPRPPLYLLNEYDVKKMVSTTLCPFKISYPNELRNWEECAEFIADYFNYVPLAVPGQCPPKLHSLDSILKARKGNCLELSAALCSFLLASSYDAYVVQGYAVRELCENAETDKPAPEIRFQTKSQKYEKFPETGALNLQELGIHLDENRYDPKHLVTILDLKGKRSEYFDWMEGRKAGAEQIAEETRKRNANRENLLRKVRDDAMHGKRVHFWILMRFVENGKINTFFIESATGEKRPIDDSQYLRIEFVWNDRNFWFSKQVSGKEGCGDMSFDFKDRQKWEAFLLAYRIEPTILDGALHGQTPMPGSWVTDIEITHDDLDQRFPLGRKEVLYKMSKLEKYNPYEGEDGLVYKMTYYSDDERQRAIKICAFYLHRDDKLESRVTELESEVVTEEFDRGRTDALKSHVYHLHNPLDEVQNMSFYSHLRDDKLCHRRWTNACTLEEFSDRDDYLESREVYYYVPADHRAEAAHEVVLTDDEEEMDYQKEVEIEVEIEKSKHVEERTPAEEEMAESGQLESVDKDSDVEPENLRQLEEMDVALKKAMMLNMEGSLKPSSFESSEVLLNDMDFTEWTFQDFINSVDLCERYVSSSSDDEGDVPIAGSAEQEEYASEEESPEEDKGDFEDGLSDEELDTDYQLFLLELMDELHNVEGVDTSTLGEEIKKPPRVLIDTKKRLRKKRRYRRFAQRKEFGKPTERYYKRKADDKSKVFTNEATESLIAFLDLEANFGIADTSELPEWVPLKDLERKITGMKNKEDALRYLGRKVKMYCENHDLDYHRYIQMIKDTYRRNEEVSLDIDVKNLWFFLDMECYRLQHHYHEDRLTSRELFFFKPRLKSPNVDEFIFNDELYKEMMPGFDMGKLSRPVLFYELVDIMQREPVVINQVVKLQDDIHDLLERRHSEARRRPKRPVKGLLEQSHLREEYNEALYQYDKERKKHDYILYAIEKLRLCLPLTADEAGLVYRTISREFCDNAYAKLHQVEHQFDRVECEYDDFLELELAKWGDEWSPEQEQRFQEACGRAYGLFLCVGKRCDALCETISSRYLELKRNLYKDTRLSAFIESASARKSSSGVVP